MSNEEILSKTIDPQERQFHALLECSFIGNEKDAGEYMHSLQQLALKLAMGVHHPNIRQMGHYGGYAGFETDPVKCADSIAGIARAAVIFLSRALAKLPDTVDQCKQSALLSTLVEMNSMIAKALQAILEKKGRPNP